MKKVIRLIIIGLTLFPICLYSQTTNQVITLNPAKGYDGVKALPFVKLFFSVTDSLVLEWATPIPSGGGFVRIGASTGTYSWQVSVNAGAKRVSFVPGKSLGLTTHRYYAMITNSSGKTLTAIQAEAKSNSSIVLSNEIQFIMESSNAPTPTGPKGTITTSTPLFNWSAISGVPAYWIIVSSTPFVVKTDSLNNVTVQGANIVWDYISTGSQATYGQISPSSPFTHEAIPLFPGNTFYYTILNMYDETDVAFASSVFGGVVSFTYQSAVAIAAPNLVAPTENKSFSGTSTIRFQWDPIQGANSYTVYLFNRVTQFAGSPQELDLPMWNGTTTNTVIDFAARQNLMKGKYVWFVVPNTSTGAGNQSVKRTFIYDVPMSTLRIRLLNVANGTELVNYKVVINSTTGAYSPSVPYIVSNSSSVTDSIPTDVYRFTAQKVGFFDSTYTFAVTGTKTNPTQLSLYVRQYPASISGKVVDQTGAAVQGATVQLTNISTNVNSSISTSTTGDFSLGLPQASYRVNISKPGYLSPAQTTLTVDQSQVIVSTPYRLVLDNAGISGKIVNDNNEPIQLAVVRATKGGTVQEVSSNGNGFYSFQLSSGSWTIETGKSGFVSPSPLTVNLATADNLQNQNLILIPRANQLSGTVYKVITTGTQSTLSPFANATVTASPVSGQVVTTVTGSNGQFAMSLRTGSYNISVAAQGYTPNRTPQVTLGVGETLSGIDFTMNPNPSSISGSVFETGNVLLADAIISNGTVSTTSLPGGSFQLSLSSGTHTLTVTKPGYITPKPLSVVLTPGQTLSGISFLLDPNAATITGSVASLGNSLAGATITAKKGTTDSATVKTSATGDFVLSVQPGNWTLTASKQGFLTATPEAVYVGAGQTSANHNYSLVSNTGTIKGIASGGNTPIPGATVYAKDKNNAANTFSTLSNVNGEYLLTVTAGTEYTFLVSSPGYTTYNNASVSIAVAGSAQNINAVLNPVAASISGKVLDNEQHPINDAVVYLINPLTAAVVDSTMSSVTGEYTIGSAAGNIRLRAFYPGYTRDSVSISVTLGQTLSNISFKITPNFALLSGSVKDQNGAAVSGAFVSLSAADGGGSAESGTDGAFSITKLVGNTFALSVKKSGYGDFSQPSYVINDGETKTLSVTLQKLVGAISGQVLDNAGSPIAQASVYVTDTLTAKAFSALSDATGKYAFAGLPLAAYKVTAVKDKYSSSLQVPVTLSTTSQTAVANINDLVKSTGQIKGTVTDNTTSATPIAGATITIRGSKGAGNAITDLSGKFTVTDLVSDTYNVLAQKPGYASDSLKTVVNADAFQLKLQSSNVPISGTVRNQQGNALGFVATVKASSGQTVLVTTTDAAGNFSFANGNKGTQYDIFTEIFKDGYSNAHSIKTTPVDGSALTSVALAVEVRTGTISGNVGVPSAAINVKNQTTNEEINSISSSDGSYAVKFLLNGTYTVTPTKIGYSFSPVSATGVAVAVGGSATATFSATVNAGNMAVGVKDNNSAPLDSVLLNITSTDNLYSYSGLSTAGAYTFNNIPPKTYILQAAKTGYGTQTVNVVVANNATATQAVTLTKNSVQISGSVSAPNGSIANATVIFRNNSTGQTFSVASSSSGNYVFGSLPAGDALITAVYSGYNADTLHLTLAQGDSKIANISLKPTFVNLTGLVTYNGSGLAGVSVQALSSNSYTATTDANGTFGFKNLPIKIGTNDTTLYKVTISGADIQSQTRSLAIAATQVASTIPIAAFVVPSGKISVTLTDGANFLEGVKVVFLRPDGTQREIVTDNTGKFESAAKLSAGTYKLSVSKENYLTPNDALTTYVLVNDFGLFSATLPLRYKITPLPSIDASTPDTLTIAYGGDLPAGVTGTIMYRVANGIQDSVKMVANTNKHVLTGIIPALSTLAKVTYSVIIREPASGAVYTSGSYSLQPEAGGILSSVSFNPAIDNTVLRTNDTYLISTLIRDGKNVSLLDYFNGAAPVGSVSWSANDTSVVFSYPTPDSKDSVKIHPTKDGTYKITATVLYKGVTVSQVATVTVGNIPLKSIDVTTSNHSLSNKSKGIQFGYTGVDTAKKSVTLGTNLAWSIQPKESGTIDPSGFFTPIDSTFIGTVTVQALDQISGKKGSTDVSVYADVYPNSSLTLTDKQGMTLVVVPNAVHSQVRLTLAKAQFGPGKKYFTPVGATTSYVVSDKQYFIVYDADIPIANDTLFEKLTLQVPVDNSLRSFDGGKSIGIYNTGSNDWSLYSTTDGTVANSLTAKISKFGEYSILVENEPLGIAYASVLPTPFSPKIAPVKIGYKLNTQQPPASVTIKVFNMRGELVSTVAQNDLQNPGIYGSSSGTKSITWDGKTTDGLEALNGRYIIQIVAKDPTGEVSKLIPVVLVK